MLLATGIPPIRRPDIVEKLMQKTEENDFELRERRRGTLRKLNEMGRQGIATLGELARKAIYDGLRANNGEFKLDIDIRVLVLSQNLPRPCNDMLNYRQ